MLFAPKKRKKVIGADYNHKMTCQNGRGLGGLVAVR